MPELSNLKSELSTLKSELSTLKSELLNLKSELLNLKSEISNLKFPIHVSSSPNPRKERTPAEFDHLGKKYRPNSLSDKAPIEDGQPLKNLAIFAPVFDHLPPPGASSSALPAKPPLARKASHTLLVYLRKFRPPLPLTPSVELARYPVYANS